jgi:hypothetical protein
MKPTDIPTLRPHARHAFTAESLLTGGGVSLAAALDNDRSGLVAEWKGYILLVIVGFLGYFQLLPNWSLVGVIAWVIFPRFFMAMDHGVSLMLTGALIALVQWLIAPLLFYYGNYNNLYMGMAVDENSYFSLAVPGAAAFILGLLVLGRTVPLRPILRSTNTSSFFASGMLLLVVSFASDIAASVVPGSLSYFFHLLSQVRYVGFLYFLFSPGLAPKLLAVASLFPLYINSAASAMFHDLLLWLGILFNFWFARRERSHVFKALVIVLVVGGCFTIQGIKGSYREKVWSGQKANLGEHLVDFWSDSLNDNTDEIVEGALARINQGWIVTHVQAHVPSGEPYAHGETVKDAFVAALLPRFIYDGKHKAGGRSNFIRFTGLEINEKTTMTISLLGEGYANFGRAGCVFFLLFMGLAMAGSHSLLLRSTRQHPLFLFWIPMVFYQAIKAETDLTEILNHVVKGSIVAITGFYLLEKVYPRREAAVPSNGLAE